MSTTRCHTFTGQGFDPFRPNPEDVRLEDVAHQLALTNRYGGATPEPYSVAQHAVSVARLVLDISGDPIWALHGLHHDSAEAYIHDIRRPIKQALILRAPWATPLIPADGSGPVPFILLEAQLLSTIRIGLGVPCLPPDEEEGADGMIEAADLAMLHAEMLGLFGEEIPRESMILAAPVLVTDCLDWRASKAAFLAAHHDLMAQIGRGA